jgi:Xaa-Pro aminopeptidase
MEYSAPPCDLDAVRLYRLSRVREALARHDYAGALLFDQLNTRYATDATNMQIWCMHNETRYLWVSTDGPVVLFEYGACAHLAEGLPTVDEVRPCRPFFYYTAGPEYRRRARVWADEIVDLVIRHGGGNRRIAVDRMNHLGIDLLRAAGLECHDGFEVMERARSVKSDGEIALMREAIRVCELGMQAMHEALRPGITENALWSKLHEVNVARGGEWIETRLLSSGPRTNPWFRESSMRRIEKGELVSFDTDLVGPYGYCSDISRAWVCGEVEPTPVQRDLHALALEQIAFNTELLKAGVATREIAERAWKIPDRFVANRYGVVMHGVGLCDEYPSVKHAMDFDTRGYDAVLEPGMVMCVESYMGAEDGCEGVKLEEQVLVTDTGVVPLSTFSLEL